MIVVNANTLSSLPIGRCGENLARKVVFDIRDLESLYGPGVAELIYQRPGDAAPYPVAAVREGDTLLWTPTATDTAKESTIEVGSGHCELRWYVGDILAKSKIWRTCVEPAMDTPSETAPPEPEQGWVDQVLAAGAAAMTAADGAKADADRAAALAAEVAEKAAQAAQDASDAAKAMEAAQTAQRLAEEAQGAAETARTAAETAQAAAEQSATDAAGAKQGAETAMQAAQEAAAAAANALEAIRTLYQEMQTWAQGVVQDVNAAGSHAVQSVQSAGDAQVQRVTDEGTTQTANAKAQADAAALSAAGAAQSAQQAAESAAVYDTVVADVTRLKADVADNAKSDAVTKRSLDALWKLNQGISYEFQTDDTAAYQKTVPSGAKLVSVGSIGGHTEVIDGELVSADVESVVERGKNLLDGEYKKDNSEHCTMYKGTGLMLAPGVYTLSYFENGTLKIASGLYVRDVKDGLALSSVYSRSSLTFTIDTYKNVYFDTYGASGTAYALTGNYDDRSMQLKLGDSVTEYEPFHLNTYPIPAAVRALPGYGWSAGSVCNSIERTETGWKYVQRVGSRDYQDGDTVTDGVTTYYELDTPVITDITDLMDGVFDAITVETGGTLTFENAAKLDVPNTVEYAVKLSEVGV